MSNKQFRKVNVPGRVFKAIWNRDSSAIILKGEESGRPGDLLLLRSVDINDERTISGRVSFVHSFKHSRFNEVYLLISLKSLRNQPAPSQSNLIPNQYE